MFELHVNGRIYDNTPLKKIWTNDKTTDKIIIDMIDSYVEYTIDQIIVHGFYLRD